MLIDCIIVYGVAALDLVTLTIYLSSQHCKFNIVCGEILNICKVLTEKVR